MRTSTRTVSSGFSCGARARERSCLADAEASTTGHDTIVAWLRDGGPWGVRPREVETHAARVFLVGDRAFKLKKPVNLGFLDFSTLEKRRQALVQEFDLNQIGRAHV